MLGGVLLSPCPLNYSVKNLSDVAGQNMELMKCAVINGIGLAKILTAMDLRIPQINLDNYY